MASEFDKAVEALRAGKPVVFPTDTVYGLGVSVKHARTPQALYDIKKRDAGKPIAWLVGGIDALDEYGEDVPACARELAEKHWPGALTIIVKANGNVPSAFRSSAGTIGLRMPANDIALKLIEAVGSPLATSSANVSGAGDAASSDQIDPAVSDQAAVVVSDGQVGGGVASTVIDCSQEEIVVLRKGSGTIAALEPRRASMTDQTFTVPFEFASHDGVSRINAKLWTNTKFGSSEEEGSEKPKAVIQLVHGMAEYIDRYDDFARYLVDRGFVVCAEDHIGHGGSAASAEDYGHMPVVGGKDILISDVHTLRTKVAECFPDVPYVIYGHSMGSFIVRAYIARHGEGLSACVLSGTGNVPAALSKTGRTLARAIAKVKGERYRSGLIDGMGAGGYGKQIENARTNLDWLSTDDAVVDKYIADEKCGFMFTVGGYSTLLDLTAEVVTPECAAKVPKSLPVLFVAGDGDPVGDMGKGVKAAAQLLRDAGVEDVVDKIYPGMRHEIHNEIGHEQVYDDVASWVEKAVAR